jgi:acetoin utilization deacetylase AcuC-like enzyme
MPSNRVAYFYQENVGHHYYGPGHPMKPIRIKLAHHLILNYGLYRKMECYVRSCPRRTAPCRSARGSAPHTSTSPSLQRPHVASAEEMSSFHSDDYIDFLRRVSPETAKSFQGQMQKCASIRARFLVRAGVLARARLIVPTALARTAVHSQLRRIHRLSRLRRSFRFLSIVRGGVHRRGSAPQSRCS